MERYCITNEQEESVVWSNHDSICVYPFTILNIVKNNVGQLFSECQEEIKQLFEKSTDENCIVGDEESMYFDILESSASSELMKLDVCLHTYYTLLYQKNKNTFIALTPSDWTKEERDNLRSKRKECNRYNKKKQDRKVPFTIVEGANEKVSDAGKTFYKETTIQDFAPNIARVYYLCDEFKNVFCETKKADAKKYNYMQMKTILNNQIVLIARKEEIWLSERLLGINLAIAFYSLFSVLLKGITFKEIENEYQKDIRETVHEVMRWEGVYSRSVIVHKLKVICELRIRSSVNEGMEINVHDLLKYIIESVLSLDMPSFAREYKYLEQHLCNDEEKKDDVSNYIKTLESISGTLLAKYLNNVDNYYFIKDNNIKIENEKLYALIQKLIISEL